LGNDVAVVAGPPGTRLSIKKDVSTFTALEQEGVCELQGREIEYSGPAVQACSEEHGVCGVTLFIVYTPRSGGDKDRCSW